MGAWTPDGPASGLSYRRWQMFFMGIGLAAGAVLGLAYVWMKRERR